MPSGRIAVFGGSYDALNCGTLHSGYRDVRIGREPDARPAVDGIHRDRFGFGGRAPGGRSCQRGWGRCGGRGNLRRGCVGRCIAARCDTGSIRALLADNDPTVVNEATEWLVGLGPQVQRHSGDLGRRWGVYAEPTGRQRSASIEGRELSGRVVRGGLGSRGPSGFCLARQLRMLHVVGRRESRSTCPVDSAGDRRGRFTYLSSAVSRRMRRMRTARSCSI